MIALKETLKARVSQGGNHTQKCPRRKCREKFSQECLPLACGQADEYWMVRMHGDAGILEITSRSSAVHPGMEHAGCSPCSVLDASASVAWGDGGGVFELLRAVCSVAWSVVSKVVPAVKNSRQCSSVILIRNNQDSEEYASMIDAQIPARCSREEPPAQASSLPRSKELGDVCAVQ